MPSAEDASAACADEAALRGAAGLSLLKPALQNHHLLNRQQGMSRQSATFNNFFVTDKVQRL
jgi:hypothetical protein